MVGWFVDIHLEHLFAKHLLKDCQMCSNSLFIIATFVLVEKLCPSFVYVVVPDA